MSAHSYSAAWFYNEQIRVELMTTEVYIDQPTSSAACQLGIRSDTPPSTEIWMVLRLDQLRMLHIAIGQYLGTIPDEEARL